MESGEVGASGSTIHQVAPYRLGVNLLGKAQVSKLGLTGEGVRLQPGKGGNNNPPTNQRLTLQI